MVVEPYDIGAGNVGLSGKFFFKAALYALGQADDSLVRTLENSEEELNAAGTLFWLFMNCLVVLSNGAVEARILRSRDKEVTCVIVEFLDGRVVELRAGAWKLGRTAAAATGAQYVEPSCGVEPTTVAANWELEPTGNNRIGQLPTDWRELGTGRSQTTVPSAFTALILAPEIIDLLPVPFPT